MHQQFNIQQLYVLPTLFTCFVFIWEQTATCGTYSIKLLVFITEMKRVYCAVRTGSLNKAVCASYLKVNILMCIFPSSYFLTRRNRRSSLGNLGTEGMNICYGFITLVLVLSEGMFKTNMLYTRIVNTMMGDMSGWFLFCHIIQEPNVDGGGSLSSLYFVCWSYPFFQQIFWGFKILSERIYTVNFILLFSSAAVYCRFHFSSRIFFRPFPYQEAFTNSAVYCQRKVNFL